MKAITVMNGSLAGEAFRVSSDSPKLGVYIGVMSGNATINTYLSPEEARDLAAALNDHAMQVELG